MINTTENGDSAITESTEENLLNTNWFWSFKPTIVYKQQTAEDWLADYQKIVPEPISSIEQFWKVYSNVPTLASLDYGNIYALFRDNITASWEDQANENGFSVVLYMNKGIPNDYMKKLYQNSLFVVIGSNCSFSDDLNGCTFERKVGGNKIAFWMRNNTTNVKEQLDIASSIIKALEIQFNDVSVVDEELRIDWRDPRFASQKITVKCVSHKKRATEPMPIKNRQRSPIRRYDNRRRQDGGREGNRGTSGNLNSVRDREGHREGNREGHRDGHQNGREGNRDGHRDGRGATGGNNNSRGNSGGLPAIKRPNQQRR